MIKNHALNVFVVVDSEHPRFALHDSRSEAKAANVVIRKKDETRRAVAADPVRHRGVNARHSWHAAQRLSQLFESVSANGFYFACATWAKERAMHAWPRGKKKKKGHLTDTHARTHTQVRLAEQNGKTAVPAKVQSETHPCVATDIRAAGA